MKLTSLLSSCLSVVLKFNVNTTCAFSDTSILSFSIWQCHYNLSSLFPSNRFYFSQSGKTTTTSSRFFYQVCSIVLKIGNIQLTPITFASLIPNPAKEWKIRFALSVALVSGSIIFQTGKTTGNLISALVFNQERPRHLSRSLMLFHTHTQEQPSIILSYAFALMI